MVDATDLKSVLAKSGVWVRIPSSAPSKISILLGKLVRARDFVDYELSRTKTAPICQVFAKCATSEPNAAIPRLVQ